MSPGLCSFLVVLLLAAAAGWLLLFAPGPDAPGREPPGAAAPAVEAAPPEVPLGEGEGLASRGEDRGAGNGRREERTLGQEVASLLDGLPAAGILEVRVVEAGTRAPIPGARVWWLPGDSIVLASGNGLFRSGFWGQGDPAQFAALGKEVVADGRGVARLPRLGLHLELFGRRGIWEGFGQAVAGQTRALLELVETGTVAIQAVDERERPAAGVPVVLYLELPQTRQHLWSGSTRGEEGTASARVPLGHRWAHGLMAMLANPLFPAEPVAVPGQGPGSPPVRLRLPPHGRAVVRLAPGVEGGGEGFSCQLQAMPSGSWSWLAPWWALAEMVPFSAGRACFPHVGLGASLTVRLFPPGYHLGPPREAAAGPCSPGEEVVVTVDSLPQVGGFSGQVVDEAGLPLAGTLIAFLRYSTIGYGELVRNPSSFFLLRTDGAGRFLWRHCLYPGLAVEGEVVAWTRSTVSGDAAGPRGAFSTTAGKPGEIVDLGVIRLRPSPVIVSGVALDDAGRPVPGLPLRLTGRLAEGGREGVHPVLQEYTATDGGGRFELLGERWGGVELWVPVNPERWDARPMMVAAGTREVRFEVARPPGIAGWLLAPGFLDPSLLRVAAIDGRGRRLVAAIPLEGRGLPPGAAVTEGATGSGFLLAGLEAGLYTLAVDYGDYPLARIPAVGAGSTPRDPRLDPLDLASLLERRCFRAVDGESHPVCRVGLAAAAEGVYRELPAPPFRLDGRFTAVVPKGASGLAVWGIGLLPMPLPAGEPEVVLRPALLVPLTVEVRSPPGSPGEFQFRVELEPLAGGEGSRTFSLFCRTPWQAAGREGHLAPVPGPGRYAVRWWIRRTTGGSGRELRHAPEPPVVIEAAAGGGEGGTAALEASEIPGFWAFFGW